jgi:hypothetical protein
MMSETLGGVWEPPSPKILKIRGGGGVPGFVLHTVYQILFDVLNPLNQ